MHRMAMDTHAYICLAVRMLGLGLLLTTSTGCQDLSHLSQDLDGSRSSTREFWGRMQSLEIPFNEQLGQEVDAAKAYSSAGNIDAAADAYDKAAQLFSQVARAISGLESKHVDPAAVTYVNTLNAAHELAAQEFAKMASAIRSRDALEIKRMQEPFRIALQNYVDIWNSRQEALQVLNSKYGGDFNTVWP